MARKKTTITIPNMWFFRMTREQRVQHQTCNNPNCTEYGIFSPDNYRNWYCNKHMEENYERPTKS